MTHTNYALRLQASLKMEAERLARAEGTTLNQFINVAVAEKIAALRTVLVGGKIGSRLHTLHFSALQKFD